MELTLKIKDIGEDGRIATIGTKVVYSTDRRASAWVRPTSHGEKIDVPILKNSCSVVQKGNNSYTDDAMGMFHSAGNDIGQNFQKVALFSTAYCGAGSCIINTENFWRCIAMFSARKLILGNWINDKDEYMVPNTEHPEYQQWLNDALVYSLFNTSSNQSSLRQVEYKGKKWDIVNHFFFMSLAEIEALALQHNNNDVYNDCKSHPPDRFVYARLQQCQFSPDAEKVLDMARELVRKSFSLREACHNVKPEMHINTWDAGWYQIKNGLLKDSFKADYEVFVAAYKALEERLREGVYTFGFLKK